MTLIDQITSDDLERLADMVAARTSTDSIDEVVNPQSLDEARREGVQDALHILSSAMLVASTHTPMTDGEGKHGPLDLHTVKALFNVVQKRTGIPYSGARKRR